jgi:hypothetical protein
MGRFTSSASAALAAGALFVLTGCSNSSAPMLEGTVTLDSAPVDGGRIAFFPDTTDKREIQAGSAHADIVGGKYALEGKNLPRGTYRVEIYWWKKTGKKVPSSDLPVDEKIQLVPEEYNTFSSLKAEIGSGTTTKNFDLKTSGARIKGRKRTQGD